MGNHHTSCMVATAPLCTVPLRGIFPEWNGGDGLWQSHMQTTGFCRLWWPYLFHVGTGRRSFCTSLHHCFFNLPAAISYQKARRLAKFQNLKFQINFEKFKSFRSSHTVSMSTAGNKSIYPCPFHTSPILLIQSVLGEKTGKFLVMSDLLRNVSRLDL